MTLIFITGKKNKITLNYFHRQHQPILPPFLNVRAHTFAGQIRRAMEPPTKSSARAEKMRDVEKDTENVNDD